jgi:nucleolar GTP-binding protein
LVGDLNPFRALRYIPDHKVLLDTAFSRAAKLNLAKSKKPAHVRAREKEIAKLRSIQDSISTRLDEVVKGFPNFDNIEPFYRALADTVVPIDELRQALASVTSAIRVLRSIVRDSQHRLTQAETPLGARRLRVSAYGRIASVIDRLNPRLEVIRRAATEYRRFPSIDLTLPVIVVAGFPNVGKSSFVTWVSTAQPEIAEYPFTTKKISVGHFPLDPKGGQVLDIPGLLDRPMEERNPIERRAIAALQYLADCILFLIDPTLTCGYELTGQVALFREVNRTFPMVELYPLLNKCDIATQEEKEKATTLLGVGPLPQISSKTGEGVETVFRDVLKTSMAIQRKLKALRDQPLSPQSNPESQSHP